MKRILVCGDLKGNFKALAAKLEVFKRKGQIFDFCVCVGTTLSLEISLAEYTKSKVDMITPVYFIDSSEMSQCLNHMYPTGSEIAKNIHFLGRSGITQISGLSVAFINGLQSNKYTELYTEQYAQNTSFTGPYFCSQDIKLLEEEVKLLGSSFRGVDIFLSCQWPEGSQKFTSLDFQPKRPSNQIAKITSFLSPRYHFAATENKYFARFPYQNSEGHMSRLVCVGEWGNNAEKHICGFEMEPLQDMSIESLRIISQDSTPSPYAAVVAAQPKFKDISISIQQEIQQELIEQNEQDDDNDKNKTTTIVTNQLISDAPQASESVSSTPQVPVLDSNKSIYFGGFDSRTNDDDIIEFLSRWGKIATINLVYEEKSKKHKGYGFVKFADLAVTQQVLQDSNKYSLHSKHIKFALANHSNNQANSTKGKQNDKCWFCYSNPQIDKSLIFFEGKHCYLALDKGPVSKNHFMIIPYEHLGASTEFSKELSSEVEYLKSSILRVFDQGYGQGMIVFERYAKLAANVQHAIISCLPLDQEQVEQFQEKFEGVVKDHKMNFFKIREKESIKDLVENKTDYFFNIDIYIRERNCTKYLYVFKENERFPMDFGRQIICEILKLPQRLLWKNCQLGKEELTDCIEEMKFNCVKFNKQENNDTNQ